MSKSVFDSNNKKGHLEKTMFFDEAVDIARYDQLNILSLRTLQTSSWVSFGDLMRWTWVKTVKILVT